MNNGWFVEEIDNLCNVEYGTRVVKKKNSGTIYSVYGGGEATFFMDDYNREDRLIIARFAMSQKCTRFVREKFFLNDSGLTLSPKNNIQLDQGFLDYQCLALNDVFYSLAKGSAQKNLDVPAFRKIKLKIPKDIEVQKKIVIKLNIIFAEIDKATASVEANVKNAEALFQCYLSEVFKRGGNGWIVKKLKNITDKIGSGATPRGGNKAYKTSGISLIRSMNIYDEGFYYPKLAFIDNTQAKQLDNVKIEKEDVLLNITGASIARCCIVPDKILPARVNQHVSILRANRNIIIPKLIHYLLISPFHKNKLLSVGEGSGATRQALTKAQLQEYEISFPSDLNSQLKLVEKISDFYSHTFSIKNIYGDKIKNFPLLKHSILQRAFNGELFKAA